MWKVQTGERALFYWTLLVFTQAGGQWFMTPIIVHQSKEHYQYLHFNIPLDWKVHHTPSGYMDIDWWLKSMTQFSNLCGASPVNNQIIFFDGHDSHFDGRPLRPTEYQEIQPFLPKPGDSTNNHLSDNGPNYKLNSLYNEVKSAWILKYGTAKFLPRHVNSLLGVAWDTLKVSSGNTIRHIL